MSCRLAGHGSSVISSATVSLAACAGSGSTERASEVGIGDTWLIQEATEFLRMPTRGFPRWLATLAAPWLLLVLLAPAPAWAATELRDAELVAGAAPVLLQNGSGTVRLEDSRLGRPGAPTFVPEPGALVQLCSGAGLLALFASRRRRRPPTLRGGTRMTS